MYDDEPEVERIHEESEARLGDRERLTAKAKRHDTRRSILIVLAKGGGKKELTAWQIRCLLPRKRRPSLASVKYHLRVLCTARLTGNNDDPEDPLYKLI